MASTILSETTLDSGQNQVRVKFTNGTEETTRFVIVRPDEDKTAKIAAALSAWTAKLGIA